jgi:hypothetical protein
MRHARPSALAPREQENLAQEEMKQKIIADGFEAEIKTLAEKRKRSLRTLWNLEGLLEEPLELADNEFDLEGA